MSSEQKDGSKKTEPTNKETFRKDLLKPLEGVVQNVPPESLGFTASLRHGSEDNAPQKNMVSFHEESEGMRQTGLIRMWPYNLRESEPALKQVAGKQSYSLPPKEDFSVLSGFRRAEANGKDLPRKAEKKAKQSAPRIASFSNPRVLESSSSPNLTQDIPEDVLKRWGTSGGAMLMAASVQFPRSAPGSPSLDPLNNSAIATREEEHIQSLEEELHQVEAYQAALIEAARRQERGQGLHYLPEISLRPGYASSDTTTEETAPSKSKKRKPQKLMRSTMKVKIRKGRGPPELNSEKLTQCPNSCGDFILTREVEDHIANFCSCREVTCKMYGCHEKVILKDMKLHLNKYCRAIKKREKLSDKGNQQIEFQPCSECGEQVRLKDMGKHLEEECQRRLVECTAFGCSAMVAEGDMLAHQSSDTCKAFKNRNNLLETAKKAQEQAIECSGCHEMVTVRGLAHHMAHECPHRKVRCPNFGQGCTEELPANEVAEHLLNSCKVHQQREELAEKYWDRRKVVECPSCGEMMELRFLAKHENTTCRNRVVPCRNWELGCNKKVRIQERKEHEDVNRLLDPRSCIYFSGGEAEMVIQEEGVKPPWTLELWLYKPGGIQDAALKTHAALLEYEKYFLQKKIERDARAMIKVLEEELTKVAIAEAEERSEANAALKRKITESLLRMAEMRDSATFECALAKHGFKSKIKAAARAVDALKATGMKTYGLNYYWPNPPYKTDLPLPGEKKGTASTSKRSKESNRSSEGSVKSQTEDQEQQDEEKPKRLHGPFAPIENPGAEPNANADEQGQVTEVGSELNSVQTLMVSKQRELSKSVSFGGVAEISYTSQAFEQGQFVLGKFLGLEWRPGQISLLRENGTADVIFDHGAKEVYVSFENIKLDKNSHIQEELTEFTVGQQVKAKFMGMDWRPGRVAQLRGGNRTDVLFDHGAKEIMVPNKDIKGSRLLRMDSMDSIESQSSIESDIEEKTQEDGTVTSMKEDSQAISGEDETVNDENASQMTALESILSSVPESEDEVKREVMHTPGEWLDSLHSADPFKFDRGDPIFSMTIIRLMDGTKLADVIQDLATATETLEAKEEAEKKSRGSSGKRTATREGNKSREANMSAAKRRKMKKKAKKKKEREEKHGVRIDKKIAEAILTEAERSVLAYCEGWSLQLEAGEDDAVGLIRAGYEDLTFGWICPVDRWVHLAFVATKDRRLSLYADGRRVGRIEGSKCPLPFTGIGHHRVACHAFLQEVRVWAVQRTKAELQHWMHRLLPDDSQEHGLISWWTMEEGSGRHVKDVTNQRYRTRMRGSNLLWALVERLGFDPPTPAWRERHVCRVELRRAKLAQRGRMQFNLTACPKECGEWVFQKNVPFHQKYVCAKRLVPCSNAEFGCTSIMEEWKLAQHLASGACSHIKFRDDLAAKAELDSFLTPCPLDCGEQVKAIQIEKHMERDCSHRLLMCTNPGCDVKVPSFRLDSHAKLYCGSKFALNRKKMVQRARKRRGLPRPWALVHND